MEIGDILRVKKPYKERYGKRDGNGSYDYHFIVGHKYKITFVYTQGVNITNITTGDDLWHYVSDSSLIFATTDEWRELQLNKIL